jgi:predicted AlkP superfamily pyrophosphatase or phosphodiesterase
MLRRLSLVLTAAVLAAASLTCGVTGPRAPSLVVVIVVDQFRYDYLTRFRGDYRGGIDRLLREGAVFTDAQYVQAPTVTAVGHSVITTGATPSVSGIVGNAWYDRETGRQVTSVCDDNAHTVGADTPAPGTRCEDSDPASPRRLLVSTVGDELRGQSEASKVIGISLKARSAVLPAGHRATGAFWFDDRTGRFVSSDFYGKQLPAWVDAFNRRELPKAYVERKWDGFPAWDFHPETGSLRPYERLAASPWGNELVASMAEAAIDAERLGLRGVTDILCVSFSSNDYVGHAAGPDAPEVRDLAMRTDALIGSLIDNVTARLGTSAPLFVFTSDHGVAPLPEQQAANRMPGGYVYLDLEDAARTALSGQFGPAAYVAGVVDNAIYFDRKVLAAQKVDLETACRVVADALRRIPQVHLARVFTGAQLASGTGGDRVERAFGNGYFPARSGDLLVVFEPYWMIFSKSSKTTHFSAYSYDTHVPLILLGPRVQPGSYHARVEMNDVAPTLSVLLNLGSPSGSSGRVLAEAIRGW